MRNALIRNWKTTLIGVLIIALAIYVWFGKASLREAIEGFLALSGAGFIVARDAKTQKQAEEEANNYMEVIQNEIQKSLANMPANTLANRADELTAENDCTCPSADIHKPR